MSTISLNNATSSKRFNDYLQSHCGAAKRTRLTQVLFTLCLIFIGSVSAWDAWLVEANTQILFYEKNPVCKFLLELDPQTKIFFFVAKGLSSMAVLATLVALFRSGYRHTMTVTTVLALFQFGLLLYLYYGDNQCGGLPNLMLIFQDTRENVFCLRYW